MKANVLDGRVVAKHIKDKLAYPIGWLKRKYNCVPHLTVILVGDDPASQVYVRNKEKACKEVGVETTTINYPSTISQGELYSKLLELNTDKSTHGILVQLPLPPHIRKFDIFDAINPQKDVDVFTSMNTGFLIQNRPYLIPCTPQAVKEILLYYGIPIKGQKIAIVNRSLVVGQPLTSMLIQDDNFANATVTVCHEYTKNIKEVLSSADIVVTAVGRRNKFTLTGDMIKQGAVVIDVAIVRDGKRLMGDADESVWEKAAWVTPVPGGVGPCTIAMLISNTVKAAEFQVTNGTTGSVSETDGIITWN